MIQKRLTLCTLIILVVFAATTVNAAKMRPEKNTPSLIEQIQKRKTLKVGMDIFQPWAMKNKEGKLIGFEIDVAKRLAKDMGVKVEFVPTAWSGIIPALLTGKFDVIIGGMGITAKRALKVNFTIPYEYSGMSLVAHQELAKGFDSLDDFNKKNIQVAVKLGTTAASAAQKYLPKAKLRMFDTEPQLFQELRNGNVHAVVASAPKPAYEAITYSDTLFMPFTEPFTEEPIGFALRKGDHDALAFFNSWITIVEKEGWLKERHNYWFGTKKWADQVE